MDWPAPCMSDIYVFTVKCSAYGRIRVRHKNSFVRFRIDHVLLTISKYPVLLTLKQP